MALFKMYLSQSFPYNRTGSVVQKVHEPEGSQTVNRAKKRHFFCVGAVRIFRAAGALTSVQRPDLMYTG